MAFAIGQRPLRWGPRPIFDVNISLPRRPRQKRPAIEPAKLRVRELSTRSTRSRRKRYSEGRFRTSARAMIPTSTISPPVEIGLRLTGVWPNSSILFRLLWTTVMGTGLIFQYHYLLTHFSANDLSNLIDGLSTTLPYNLLFFKLIVLWVNNRYVISRRVPIIFRNTRVFRVLRGGFVGSVERSI